MVMLITGPYKEQYPVIGQEIFCLKKNNLFIGLPIMIFLKFWLNMLNKESPLMTLIIMDTHP